MKKILVLIPIFLIAFGLDSLAATDSIGDSLKIDTLNLPNDEVKLKEDIKWLDNEIRKQKKVTESKDFKASHASALEEFKTKKAEIEALNKNINSLKQTNDSIEKATKQAIEDYAYTDSLCAVACYRLLSVKPDSIFYRKKIKPSVELFHKIVTPSIKEQYKNLEVLLPNYLKYYNEVRDFLSDLSIRVECKAITSKNFQTVRENEFYRLGIIKYYGEKVTFSYLLDQIDRIEKAFGMGENAIKGRAFEQIYDNWFPALEPAPAPVVPAVTVIPVSDKPSITPQPEVLEGKPVTDNNTNKSQEGGQNVNGQRKESKKESLSNDNYDYDVILDPVTGERTVVLKKKKY